MTHDDTQPNERRPARLKRLRVTRVAFVDRGANPGAHITLYKRDDTMAKVEELEKQVADLTAKLADATAENETLRQQGEKGTAPDPLAKADPAVRARVEELEKARQAEAARNEELAARVAKMEADRDRTLYVAKAAAFPGMGKADDFGPTLGKIAKALTGDEFAAFEQALRAMHEQLATGDLFKAVGGDVAGGDNTAWGQLEKMASDLVTAGKARSFAAAMTQVLETPVGVQLHKQYRAEQEGGR